MNNGITLCLNGELGERSTWKIQILYKNLSDGLMVREVIEQKSCGGAGALFHSYILHLRLRQLQDIDQQPSGVDSVRASQAALRWAQSC